MRYLVPVVFLYAASMVAANLVVSKYGPGITPITAFVLIGLDLTLRDWLHLRLKIWQMGLMILCTGVLTFLLNPSGANIAIASSVAFTIATAVDWIAFSLLPGKWIVKANGSNIIGSGVDSILFPTIAFGSIMPHIVLGQFFAKLIGGALWSLILRRLMIKSMANARDFDSSI